MELEVLILPFLFLLGVLCGSFASVVVTRLRTGEGGIFLGRSRCSACRQTLRWYQLIPLVSYLVQWGRCRHCKATVSLVYPLVELVTGILFVTAGLFFVWDGWWQLGFWLVMLWSFVVICLYDLLYMEIPDEVSIPAIVLAAAVSVGFGYPVVFIDGLLGTLGILLFFGIQILLGHMYKKEVLGLGDLRIGALMGLLLGWQLGFLALFCSYLLGTMILLPILLLRRKNLQMAVPFGPFLTLGFLVALFIGVDILEWYLRWIGV